MNASPKSRPSLGDCWPPNEPATGHLPVFPGIEHASEEIVDLIAMAAVESGASPEPLRGHPRIHAHLEEIVGGRGFVSDSRALPPRPAAVFPSADQIALAIVAACRITGDGPMATCMRQPSRARNIALAALIEVFPDATRQSPARCCGYAKPALGTTTLGMARKAAWWNEAHVEEVIGALTAWEYGERGL